MRVDDLVCTCRGDEDFGNYRMHQAPLVLPEKFASTRMPYGYRCEGTPDRLTVTTTKVHVVSVDTCMVREVLRLWRLDVRTLECCCGHARQGGYVAVDDASIERMIDLGYTRTLDKPDRRDLFEPKTRLLTNGELRALTGVV